ncbi:MAG: hypothetical protein AAF610_07320 [Pseudomonadota bacterium]
MKGNGSGRIGSFYRAFALIGFAAGVQVHAAVPETVNYQGYLTNADGTPVNGTVNITFAIYNVDLGGVPLWNQTNSVIVEQGLFSVALADPVNPFPVDLFEGPVFVGLFVAGEELLPRRAMTSNAFAFKAANADALEGVSALELDQSADVALLEGGLTSAEESISNLATSVSSNEGRLNVLESTAGDITGIVAEQGLSGGGATGEIFLSVATNGIDSSMIANGAVGPQDLAAQSVGTPALAPDAVISSIIQDGTIQPEDLNATGSYNLGEVIVGSGGLEIDSRSDIVIKDTFNGIRWFDNSGTVSLASLTVRQNEVILDHDGQDRQVFESNENGVGLAGAQPNGEADVTVGSLAVLDAIDIGYEVVGQDFDLSTLVDDCHSHGNLPCYVGGVFVNCPVGKKPLGGGVRGHNARFGAVSSLRPTTTGYSCEISYDLPNATRTCYAICGRVE